MPLGMSRNVRLSVPMSMGIGHLALWLRQSGAEADVVVRIGAGIVAVQVEHSVVGAVVPVAATIGEPLI